MTHPCPVNLGPTKGCRRPTPDDAGICLACRADLQQALAEVPALVEDLAFELARQRGTGIGSGSRAFERPMPYDVRASEAGASLRTVLVGWVRDLCEHHRTLPAPGDTLPDMARWLQVRLPLLIAHPAAADICEEITTAVRSIWRAVDNPPARHYLGPCTCGIDLYAREGQALAACTECGLGHNVADIRARLEEAIADQSVTGAQFAGLAVHLGLIPAAGRDRLRQRVHVWANRGLVFRSRDDDGEPAYSYRRLEELLAANPTNPKKGRHMATHPICGKTWSGSRREHCPVCCETFNSQTAGDMHRVGDHQDGRRCLTVDEMVTAGMVLGDDGIWRSMADSRRDHSRQSDERGALGSLPRVEVDEAQIAEGQVA